MKFTDIGNGLIKVETNLQKGMTIYCESLRQRSDIEMLLNNKGYKTECLPVYNETDFGLYIKRDDEI